MSSSSAGPAGKICFNSQCKEPRSDQLRRKGWRLRSGDLAELCDRCCCIYEQGIFCQTFHANATGWRNCEACGKRVHCGCIASASTYMLLDAGGVECITCARKSFVAAPNQAWPSPMRMPPQASERLKDSPANNWKHMTALWHEAPKLWNMYRSQSDLNRRISYELDRNSTGKQLPGCRPSIPVQEKKFEDMPEGLGGGVNHFAQEKYVTGNTGLDSISSFNMLRREEGTYESMQDSARLVGENDSVSKRQEIISDTCPPGSTGANFESYSNSYLDMSLPSSNMKVDSPLPPMGLSSPFPSPSDGSDSYRVSSSQSNQQPAKQFGPNPCGVTDSCGDLQSQLRIRPRVDNRGRHHLLPRYWPKISDKELRQISGDSNSVITPLFEKILSASDASRVGRLVLPKKCAEAYFPVISSPEGLPIKVQDVTGNEWIFQFRFWPNNNSRMYVLEGVTPCIQSMQLQAGDTVTFSRIDPEGKLVMGFRKASGIISEQDIKGSKTGSSSPTPPEVDNRNNSPTKSSPLKPPDVGTPVTPTDAEDKPTLTNIDNAGSVEKDESNAKSSLTRATKKKGTLGSKNKRLRIDKEESDQLKISWEEAQELFRAPLDKSPNAVIIDGHEIEEYEDAPVLGKPTIFITNLASEKAQWVQCEDCSKWRKLPEDALLPFRWICSLNKWDPNRSSCTSPQELCKELQAMLNAAKAGTPKRSKAKVQVREISDGLDTLANLAILGEGESLPPSSSSPPTTKHPRHRPGCTCIVCIQPPSGKGRKHEPSCTCNVCLTVKRRFKTLMLRRAQEKKLQQQQQQELMQSPESPKLVSNDDVMILDEEFERKIATPSPLKAEIDLNIQPEREEDPSPALNGGNLMKQQHDTTMKRDVT